MKSILRIVILVLLTLSFSTIPAFANIADDIQLPNVQFESGVPINEIQCSGDRVLVQSPSGSPACVFASSVDVFEKRGFIQVSDVNVEESSTNDTEQRPPLRRGPPPLVIADTAEMYHHLGHVVTESLDELRSIKHASSQSSSKGFVVADWIPDYTPQGFRLVYALHSWGICSADSCDSLRLYFAPNSFNFTSTTTWTDLDDVGGIFYRVSPKLTTSYDSYDGLLESIRYLPGGPVSIINQTNGYFGLQKPDNEYVGFSAIVAFETQIIHIRTGSDMPHIEGIKMINSIQGVQFPE